jgi:DsbC/DsbD-like thiol-disulfide interchange protein
MLLSEEALFRDTSGATSRRAGRCFTNKEETPMQSLRIRPSRLAVALLLLTGAALMLAQAGPLWAQAKRVTSADKVKARAEASRPDATGKQTVTITLNIDKGWHLYANPVGNQSFAENQTVVEISGKAKPRSVRVEYPPGKVYEDKVLKESFRIYEGQVTIRAHVQRAAGDAGPLQVTIRVNACTEKSCLAPGTITLSVR